MQSGVIKNFLDNRGFGFIIAEDGQEYFCHISNIDIEEGQYPKIGQNVRFDVKATSKGPEAVEVQLF